MEHENVLRKLCASIAEKYGYDNPSFKLSPATTGGANYSSVLYYATLSSKDKEDLHLFVKAAPTSEGHRNVIPISAFDTECFVYSELAQKFKQIEDKYAIPDDDRFVFIKFYGSNLNNQEETIVLENLAEKGFSVYDRMKSVDWPYASKAVEVLAKFHSLCMVFSEEFPEDTKKMYEILDHRLDSAYDAMAGTIRTFVEKAINTAKPEYKDRLHKFFENKASWDFTHYTRPRRRRYPINVEYRPNNILYRVNEDGTLELIPCDYQTIRSGCVASDLVYFIFCSSDQEFRAQYYDQLIEVYYQQLCRSLRAMHYDPEKIYSREDFDTELKEVMPHGLITAIICLPVLTVDEKNAPAIDEDNFFDNMSKVNTDGNTSYADRLNGIVEDYVRWGLI